MLDQEVPWGFPGYRGLRSGSCTGVRPNVKDKIDDRLETTDQRRWPERQMFGGISFRAIFRVEQLAP